MPRKMSRHNVSEHRKAAQVSSGSHSYLSALLVAVVAGVVYLNTIPHDFVFDDIAGIVNNPLVTGFRSLSQSLHFLKEPFRSVTQFSHALIAYAFGLTPMPFHFVAVVVHAINATLIFGIAWMAALLWLPVGIHMPFALAAGLIHATHPIYTEGVTYIFGSSSSLCALFYLGSLLATMAGYAMPGRKKYLWYGCALVCGILAWMTKEEAVMLPVLIAGFLALAGCWRASLATALSPLLLAALRWNDINRLYATVAQNRALVSIGFDPSLDPWTYFLTSVKQMVFYYFRMFLLPAGLNADPYIVPVTRLSNPSLIAALLVLVSLAAAGILTFRRNRLVSFSIICILLSPLAAYAFVPLADVVAEHRAYITGLGFDLLFAWLLVRNHRHAVIALTLLALFLGFLTFRRNQVWANSLTLWQDAEKKSPQLVRPHLNLGMAYFSAGDSNRALAEYQEALAINANNSAAYLNIATVYFSRRDLDRAEDALKKAIQLSPSLSAPYFNLATIALQRQQAARALEYLDRALSVDDSYPVHLARGDVFCQMGRYADAMREYMLTLESKTVPDETKRQVMMRLQQLRNAGAIR